MTPAVVKSREEWLAMHLDPSLCSATDWVTIAGQNKWTSRFSLGARKLGKEPPQEENRAMRRGHAMEPAIAREFEIETGVTLVDPGHYTVYFHPLHEWLFCTPDRIHPAIDDLNEGAFEAKATSSLRLTQEWLEKVPVSHQIQLQCQMACMDLEWGVLCWWGVDDEFHHVRCERNDEFIELMIREATDFRDQLMRGELPDAGSLPAASTTATLKFIHPAHKEGAVAFLESDEIEKAVRLEDIKEEMKDLEEERATIENVMKARAGDAEFVDGGLDLFYSWRLSKQSFSVDKEEMIKRGLEIILKPNKRSRPLCKVKRPKG